MQNYWCVLIKTQPTNYKKNNINMIFKKKYLSLLLINIYQVRH